jgi:hypothetical protein
MAYSDGVDRTRGRLTITALLGLVAFVVGHDLVFLATYGPRYLDGLHQTGHDGSWTVLVGLTLLVALTVALIAAWRLQQLRGLAHGLEGGHVVLAVGNASELGRRVLVRSLPVALLAVGLFVLAENVEHLRAGAAAPGLAVLGSPEYTPFAPLILVGTALVIALVAGLVSWQRDRLAARIAAAERRPRLVGGRAVGRCVSERSSRPDSILGSRLASRAPPMAVRLP